MIRWRYLRNRLLLLGAVIAAVVFGAPPALRFLTISTLQKATGGRVDVASVHVGLWPPRIRYDDVRVADPRRDREDWVRAGTVELALDADALLRRRWAVETASIDGLSFSDERDTDGRLAPQPTEADDAGSRSIGPAAKALTRLVAANAQSRTERAVEQLQTVATARRLEEDWRTRYDDLATRAEEIERRIRDIRQGVREVDNPLRDLPRVRQALLDAERLQADLARIREETTGLPETLEADLGALDAARRQDQQRIADVVPIFDDRGNFNRLAPELLRDLVTGQLQRLQSYVAAARRGADLTVARPKPQRNRGVDYDLDGRSQQPAWIVRHTRLSGQLRSSGRQYTLLGSVDNLAASAPERPALAARFRLEGPETVRVNFRRDYDRDALGDRITIHLPEIEMPAYVLGDPRAATLACGRSTLELWAELQCDGSAVEGRLIAKQSGASFSTSIGDDGTFARRLETAVNRSLADVDYLDIDARIAGSWQRPDVVMQTNLEHALEDAVRQAAIAAVEETRQRLVAATNRAYDEQVERLQEVLAGHQQNIDALLARADQEVRNVSGRLASEAGVPALQVGRLPNVQLPRLR